MPGPKTIPNVISLEVSPVFSELGNLDRTQISNQVLISENLWTYSSREYYYQIQPSRRGLAERRRKEASHQTPELS